MADGEVSTVCGPVPLASLGVTLMHEHLLIGCSGWQADTLNPGPSRRDMLAVCVDRITELQDRGIRSLVDPCPNDMGRDVEFAAEVAARTGFNIVCATGLFKEDDGGAAYWKHHCAMGTAVEAMARLFIHELTAGIGETGIRAGIIKIGTGQGSITDYELTVLEAAAIAAVETGAPITTHTEDGTMGDRQQELLIARGVAPHKIVIGHSCGSTDYTYHTRILDNGSYLGFDRFGLETLVSDRQRIDSLLALLAAGHERQLVLSHDSVWCMRGKPFPDALLAHVASDGFFNPTHIHDRIIPQLLQAGVSRRQIDTLLIDNPRRFFSGSAPANPEQS
ncbi:MAG: Phosphotriesterase homology protein [Pseudomonadales bacterium]|nr:Phosphotriesterase homology protein [Pseudomonadales bacterium]